MFSPIPAHTALSVALLAETHYTLPDPTVTGPVCGGCSADQRKLTPGSRVQVRHASVEHIRFCQGRIQGWADEAKAEQEAEAAVERFFEERGYDEARAQEDFESRTIDFYRSY